MLPPQTETSPGPGRSSSTVEARIVERSVRIPDASCVNVPSGSCSPAASAVSVSFSEIRSKRTGKSTTARADKTLEPAFQPGDSAIRVLLVVGSAPAKGVGRLALSLEPVASVIRALHEPHSSTNSCCICGRRIPTFHTHRLRGGQCIDTWP